VGYLPSLYAFTYSGFGDAETVGGLGHGETKHLVSGTVTGLVKITHGVVLPTVTPMLAALS
jgi:hypothetical protein